MRGIVRPCRHSLEPHLRERWRAHQCGLCLTLRDEAGQPSRVLTGYDVLLLSVLVEAQMGALPRAAAGPCPLRGFRPASVIAADTDAMQLAAAGALLTAAAGLADKMADGDLSGAGRTIAARTARNLRRRGLQVLEHLPEPVRQFAPTVLQAPSRAARAEGCPAAGLEALLAPSGQVVGALFAATAETAGRPANAAALQRAGDAFGRLVHLVDAADDFRDDARRGRFNPLTATGADPRQVGELATALHARLTAALGEADLVDRDLVDALFGPTLQRTVERLQPPPDPTPAQLSVPAQRSRSAAFVPAAVAAVATLGVFGGGGPRWGRRRGPWDQGPYGPYGRPGYGYGPPRRSGCAQLLACDCCANLACNACCGEDVCCCCV